MLPDSCLDPAARRVMYNLPYEDMHAPIAGEHESWPYAPTGYAAEHVGRATSGTSTLIAACITAHAIRAGAPVSKGWAGSRRPEPLFGARRGKFPWLS